MPLDTFVKKPVQRMEVADAPDSVPEVQKICQQVIDKWEGRHAPFAGIERHAFYERSRQAFAIVATGEQRSYGCIIVKKGVVTGTARPAICERSSCFSKWLHSAHEQPAEARISYPFHPRFAEAAPTKAAYFRHSVVEEKSYQDARTSWWR
jgi:RbsD / FucU transport protein family